MNKDCTVKTILMLNYQHSGLKVVIKIDMFQFDKINTLLLTQFLYKQHFYKQRQAESGKKTNKN